MGDFRVCVPKYCDDETLLDVIKALVSYIPEGRVISYRDLGDILGVSPRRVGRILSKNKELIIYPCHRVVEKSGKVGGYRGRKLDELKIKLLSFENVNLKGLKIGKVSFFKIREAILG